MLGAVIVPCNAREKDQIIANLRLWANRRLAPFTSVPEKKPKLVFVFNNETGKSAAEEIAAAFKELNLGVFFETADTLFLDLIGRSDAYIRDYSIKVDDHGYKAGPNNQFFQTIRLCRNFGRYAFLMEADCIPIRAGWLDRLNQLLCGPEHFFVLGSAYRGVAKLAPKFARHINGNAVYAVGDPEFQAFVSDIWEPGLRKMVSEQDRTLAYDCALESMFSAMRGGADDAIWKAWQRHAHRFRYSAFIQNISASIDVNEPRPDLVRDLVENHPDTFIVHSQAVARAAHAGEANPLSWELRPNPIPAKPAASPPAAHSTTGTSETARPEDQRVDPMSLKKITTQLLGKKLTSKLWSSRNPVPGPTPGRRAFVLGNGPSLKGFDFSRLAGFDTLGMNAAYRHWDRIGWYPTYYCCLDDQLIETHHAEIDRLYVDRLVRGLFLNAGFFEKHPDRIGNPAFLSLDQCSQHWFNRRGKKLGLAPVWEHPAFKTRAPTKLTTGAYAVRYMAYLGYTDIALMGIDLRYVEILPEARKTEGVGLVMERTPESNPNYFFDDYQRAGDRYNIPNPDVHNGDLHPQSFAALRKDFDETMPQVQIINTNAQSILYDRGVFPYLAFEDYLTSGRKILSSPA